MIGGFNPSTVPSLAASIDSVFALLKVISDPASAQKYIEEIRAALADAGATAARLEAEAHRKELEAQARVLEDRKNQLNSREVGISDMARDLAAREAAFAAKMAKLKQLTP
jgi:hypothetical protein